MEYGIDWDVTDPISLSVDDVHDQQSVQTRYFYTTVLVSPFL